MRQVIESFAVFAHDPSADETFERAQRAVVIRRHKADGVSHRVGAPRATNAVNVVFRMAGEIVIDHVRDAVHVNASGRDIRRHQHSHRARFEIL